MKIGLSKKSLSLRINMKRKIMYKKAKVFGYTHPSVVEVSQELDILINRYQGI